MQELTEFNLEKATTEILMLKEQMARNIIEIGKRLIVVKENIGYGEFGEWLENEVEFSHRTANNFMKVATEFSNSQALANLGSTKLFLLAGLEEEDREEIMQENDVEKMTTRELEQVVKEKKEIAKQLKEEQEYSNELQQAIRDKEQQINKLKSDIENIQTETQIVEKEIIKEVVPDSLMQEKQRLETELETLRKRAEKAEETVRSIKLEDNLRKDETYNTAKLDALIVSVREFLDKNSKFTYLKEDLQNIPTKKKKFIEQSVNSMKEWVMLMEQALDNRKDVVGTIIYGEGEVIDE